MPDIRILLAEDEEAMRAYLHRALEKAGYEVVSVDRGTDALPKLEEEHFDLLLSDIVMPEMDGITALRKLQQDEATRHIPVIMLTALSGDSDRRIYGELGATWLISKPFDLMALPNQVETIMGWTS